MPVKPNLLSWGNSFASYAGKNINDAHKTLGEINYETLNNTTMVDGIEWTHFEENLKDFVLARLGHPVLICSLEMKPDEIYARLIAAECGVPVHVHFVRGRARPRRPQPHHYRGGDLETNNLLPAPRHRGGPCHLPAGWGGSDPLRLQPGYPGPPARAPLPAPRRDAAAAANGRGAFLRRGNARRPCRHRGDPDRGVGR